MRVTSPPPQVAAGAHVLARALPLVALLMTACGGAPPGAVEGPIEPRSAVLEDVSALRLPAPDSADYCRVAQQILASTGLAASNTVFTDMPSYRHSKPSANPHRIYQVVTYAGAIPVAVSCKVKTAAHLRAVYGPDAAGVQRSCVELTRKARSQAVTALTRDGLEAAAARAGEFVLDDDEPHVTGQAYLADFPLSHQEASGVVHLSSPGLFQDYDSWITPLLPWKFQGQHYCHTATAAYIEALARGDIEPGTVITTADDAVVTPAPSMSRAELSFEWRGAVISAMQI